LGNPHESNSNLQRHWQFGALCNLLHAPLRATLFRNFVLPKNGPDLYGERSRSTTNRRSNMKRLSLLITSLFIAASAPGQTSENTKSAGSGASYPPIGDIHAHVCGIHFYNGDISRQIIAEHYCAHRSDEVLQCVIYDSSKPGARLIGIEYIVSAKIFESLPAEEKKLWHSHNYEVKSGVLTAPGMPDTAEKDLMKVLIGTYGKTWHTWQVDRDAKLPMGIPQLMMAFTADGQAQAKILSERDSLYGSSATKKTARVNISDGQSRPRCRRRAERLRRAARSENGARTGEIIAELRSTLFGKISGGRTESGGASRRGFYRHNPPAFT